MPPRDVIDHVYCLHHWNCKHVYTSYKLTEDGLADPCKPLLHFMATVIENDSVVAEILDKHDQIKKGMSSKFRTYFIGGSYATLVEIIDNVPIAISPVSARPVYI